jgi:hypothetical protein
VDEPRLQEAEEGELGRQVKSASIARLDPRSGVRAGDLIELAVDTSRVHFFDPATGKSIWD